MTEVEFNEFCNAFANRFPWEKAVHTDSPQRNDERRALLFALFGNYDRETVERCVHTWQMDQPDANKPNLKEIRAMVASEHREACDAFTWTAADESELSHALYWYERRGLPLPTVEYVVCERWGRPRAPTPGERESARRTLMGMVQRPMTPAQIAAQQAADMATAGKAAPKPQKAAKPQWAGGRK